MSEGLVEKPARPREPDLTKIFARAIDSRARELQYGAIMVRYVIRQGRVREAYVVQREEKISPIEEPETS